MLRRVLSAYAWRARLALAMRHSDGDRKLAAGRLHRLVSSLFFNFSPFLPSTAAMPHSAADHPEFNPAIERVAGIVAAVADQGLLRTDAVGDHPLGQPGRGLGQVRLDVFGAKQ